MQTVGNLPYTQVGKKNWGVGYGAVHRSQHPKPLLPQN